MNDPQHVALLHPIAGAHRDLNPDGGINDLVGVETPGPEPPRGQTHDTGIDRFDATRR